MLKNRKSGQFLQHLPVEIIRKLIQYLNLYTIESFYKTCQYFLKCVLEFKSLSLERRLEGLSKYQFLEEGWSEKNAFRCLDFNPFSFLKFNLNLSLELIKNSKICELKFKYLDSLTIKYCNEFRFFNN